MVLPSLLPVVLPSLLPVVSPSSPPSPPPGGEGGGGGEEGSLLPVSLLPVVLPSLLPVVLPSLLPVVSPSVFTCHVASNPDPWTLLSEVKSTCKYPVDDVYSVLELTEVPDSRAICSGELHDDDEQRLIVTKS